MIKREGTTCSDSAYMDETNYQTQQLAKRIYFYRLALPLRALGWILLYRCDSNVANLSCENHRESRDDLVCPGREP